MKTTRLQLLQPDDVHTIVMMLVQRKFKNHDEYRKTAGLTKWMADNYDFTQMLRRYNQPIDGTGGDLSFCSWAILPSSRSDHAGILSAFREDVQKKYIEKKICRIPPATTQRTKALPRICVKAIIKTTHLSIIPLWTGYDTNGHPEVDKQVRSVAKQWCIANKTVEFVEDFNSIYRDRIKPKWNMLEKLDMVLEMTITAGDDSLRTQKAIASLNPIVTSNEQSRHVRFLQLMYTYTVNNGILRHDEEHYKDSF